MHDITDGRSIWMKPTVLNAAIDYFHSTDGLISNSDHILRTNSGKGRIFMVLCDCTYTAV